MSLPDFYGSFVLMRNVGMAPCKGGGSRVEPETLQGQQSCVLAGNAFNGHPTREREQAGNGKTSHRNLSFFKQSIVLFCFAFSPKTK